MSKFYQIFLKNGSLRDIGAGVHYGRVGGTYCWLPVSTKTYALFIQHIIHDDLMPISNSGTLADFAGLSITPTTLLDDLSSLSLEKTLRADWATTVKVC